MNKRRLLKLADMLEADAKNKKGIKFDLGVVGSVDDPDGTPSVSCGTTGCAMGLAAVSGAFRKAGLSFKFKDGIIDTTMNGRRVRYSNAAARLFDISIDSALFLFSPLSYEGSITGADGERIVVNRIRDFVARKVP